MKKLFLLFIPLFLFLAGCEEPSNSKSYESYEPSILYTDSFTQKKNFTAPTTWDYNLVIDYVITKCKPNARYEASIFYNGGKNILRFFVLADNNGNITGNKTITTTLYAEPTSGVDNFSLELAE